MWMQVALIFAATQDPAQEQVHELGTEPAVEFHLDNRRVELTRDHRRFKEDVDYDRASSILRKLFKTDDRVGVAVILSTDYPEFHRKARQAGLAAYLEGKVGFHIFATRFDEADPVYRAFREATEGRTLTPSRTSIERLYAEGWIDNPKKFNLLTSARYLSRRITPWQESALYGFGFQVFPTYSPEVEKAFDRLVKEEKSWGRKALYNATWLGVGIASGLLDFIVWIIPPIGEGKPWFLAKKNVKRYAKMKLQGWLLDRPEQKVYFPGRHLGVLDLLRSEY